MSGRIKIDTRFTRLLERMSEGRDDPQPAALARGERYHKAAANLGMNFDKAVEAGRLAEITASLEAPGSPSSE
jgi:hypothetical protein